METELNTKMIERNNELIKANDEIAQLKAELSEARSVAEKAREYTMHDQDCILSLWSSGEPTPDGGYRTMFNGKWYQTKPVNEHPKCECGLDDLFPKEPSDNG